jgi:hypothetical protein
MMACFPYRKSLESFDVSFQPSVDRQKLQELATSRFIAHRDDVVFLFSHHKLDVERVRAPRDIGQVELIAAMDRGRCHATARAACGGGRGCQLEDHGFCLIGHPREA